jgi:hypothetical protein
MPEIDRTELAQWLGTPAGRELLSLEKQQLSAVLPALIGYRLLQVGGWGLDDEFYRGSPMLQHWIIGNGGEHGVHAHFDGRTLPVASRSVDVVVLPHSLELVGSPHRVLREVDRVLCAHGHVVIQGFNPMGVWAAAQRMPWGKQRFPSGARFYTLNRVHDWLELLDFEIVEDRRYGMAYRWPQDEKGMATSIARLLSAPVCQAYQVLARKRVVPMTMVRQRWKREPVVSPAVIPEARVHRNR